MVQSIHTLPEVIRENFPQEPDNIRFLFLLQRFVVLFSEHLQQYQLYSLILLFYLLFILINHPIHKILMQTLLAQSVHF